ncbi:MAG: FIST C-terminal domain-containing protein [Campylobacteraceae bacterium]|nr:FIST C-terminal domain-containing protein [Campylobacteraceae bacterium]
MFKEIYFFRTLEALHVELQSGRYLLLVGEKTDISQMCFSDSMVIVGAIFPRVVFGTESFESGIVVAKLPESTSLQMIVDMNDIAALEVPENTHSVFTIVDGLSSKLDNFLENIYAILPEKTKIIGGGAGKLTLKQSPIIFDNNGIYEDSAILIYSQAMMGIGVEHGWESIVSPLMATNCRGHMLDKINYKDAFLVYKEAVECDSSERFNEDNFFDIAKRYPIGIMRYNRDFIVRDPIYTDGKSLLLVGNIDQNSVIAILKGKNEKLILAAKKAAILANEYAPPNRHSMLLIDCISRFLFLENDFTLELEAIASAHSPQAVLWGMLTLGEIANANQEGIEFYNKTCVIGSL